MEDKKLKMTNMIGIIACAITYILAFSAFDKSIITSMCDDYEYYTAELICAMIMTGLIATCFVVAYINTDRNKFETAMTINIITGVFEVALSMLAIFISKGLYMRTLYGSNNNKAEEISNFHAICFVVMVCILLVISIVHLINAISHKIGHKYCELDKRMQRENNKKRIADYFVSLLVAGVLIISTLLGLGRLYGLFMFTICIPYIVVFTLPACLWLCFVIPKWEREKAYIKEMVSYIVYSVSVYGVMHCLFYKEIGGFYVSYTLENIVSVNFLCLVNVVVGIIALVVTMIRWMKEHIALKKNI